MEPQSIKSVAVIGAGASGAIAAAALAAEDCFDKIRVYERRETPGGTWIYDNDPDPSRTFRLHPGKLPEQIDPPLEIPGDLPHTTLPNSQQRWDRTPVYEDLTTNVAEVAMSFSDKRFAYGPFVPHWIPKQYIQDYFSRNKTDSFLVLNTTVEDVSKIHSKEQQSQEKWKLTLRRFDAVRHVDVWWEEVFDAVIIANGHYSVPFIPKVNGLEKYITNFPNLVSHSKTYRNTALYTNKSVLIIGNSASGHDITAQLVESGFPKLPVYQSRRSRTPWDGAEPADGIEWKPVIREYRAATKEIIFEDDSVLRDIDAVIYCTGYKPSFPFWNNTQNGGPLYDYNENRSVGLYQHTFSQANPQTIGIMGVPRVLTFRSFEYQAIALARLFSGRNSVPLPSLSKMQEWETFRVELVKKEKRKFDDIAWDNGETLNWLGWLYKFAGLPELEGKGRCPPVLDAETRWAIEHIKKYPVLGDKVINEGKDAESVKEEGWVVVRVNGNTKDSMGFI